MKADQISLGFFELAMTAISSFQNPLDLALKLFREAGRVHKASSEEKAGDHFFNFCVTNNALRDWFYESTSLKLDHNDWRLKADGLFGVCADIANSAKHLKMKRNQASARVQSNEVVALTAFGVLNGSRTQKPAFFIMLNDGKEMHHLTFLTKICIAWEELFKQELNINLPHLIEFLSEDLSCR